MKYIMLETAEGRKVPIMFPECLNHSDVADLMSRLVHLTLRSPCSVASAGFVMFDNVQCGGTSESLAGIEANPVDADRIWLGDAASHFADHTVAKLAERLRTKHMEKADLRLPHQTGDEVRYTTILGNGDPSA